MLFVAAVAQSSRRLTTIESLHQFPGYFHLQQVLVHGELVQTGSRATLRTDEHEIRLLVGAGARTATGTVAVRGMLIDVGKLEQGDARLTGYDRPTDDRWPRPGEELLLIVASVTPTSPGAPLSMRTLTLEPWRFDGQTVTLVGQFRGRNLFGDLPGAPRRSQYDFVLKSGDAALWTTGLRPRGKGFDLNVDTRVDTKQWLEVTGVVKRSTGLVTVEATHMVAVAEPARTHEREEASSPPPPLSPVEVVFSSPTAGETDVPPASAVRMQFSRNIKPESLADHLRISYVGGATGGIGSAASALEWRTNYDAATRALEVRFLKPLESFRTLKLELLEGVMGFDGAPIVPWSVTFTVGS